MCEDTDLKKLSLLYQENAKVAAIFWDSRHKVMASFFGGIGALFALTGWFYQHPELHGLLFAPLFLGAVFSFVCSFLDLKEWKDSGGVLSRWEEYGA